MELRRRVRAALPAPVDRAQAGLRAALHRAGLWAGLLREVRGATSEDQARLWRGARAAWPDLHRDPAAWREPRLLEDATVVVRDGFRFAIRGGTDDLGHVRQRTHAHLLGALLPHLPPGGVAIDAGANLGLFAANFARRAGPGGTVRAIEMMPGTAERLRRTVALNALASVEVVEAALCDRAGGTLRVAMPDAAHFGQASILRHGATGPATEVAATTLDAVAEGLDRVDVLKLDLEGAEAQALRGAAEMLGRTRAVLFEARPGDDDASAILRARGFRVAPVDRLNRLALRSEAGA